VHGQRRNGRRRPILLTLPVSSVLPLHRATLLEKARAWVAPPRRRHCRLPMDVGDAVAVLCKGMGLGREQGVGVSEGHHTG